LAAGLLAAPAVFAGGGAEEKSAGPVTVEFWNLSSRKQLTEKAVADFNTLNPDIVVKFVLNSTDDHKKNLKIAASSKSLPDFWFNWGGTLGSFYAENGLSYDLGSYAKENGWDKKFAKSSLDLATFDGNLSGYPTSINMIGMHYRADIFDKVGVKAPTTFEEFEKVCAALKAKGYTPLALSGKNGWHVMRFIEMLIEMYAGAAEHDKIAALKTSWNNPAVVKAFSKFKEFADKGYFPEGFITLNPDDARTLLYSEKAVMSPEGPWMESNIFTDQQNHDLYGYFKVPLGSSGNRMSGFVEMIQFNAKLDKKKLAAAMKFVDYLYSPEAIAKYGTLIKQPVPRNDNRLPANFTTVPAMLADLNKYGSFTITDQALPQEVAAKLFQAQDGVATGGMTPEQAAEFMQKAVEAYKATK
jgi:raffinose/stachyose/melibiose transport system substrate-binding protein